MMKKIALMIIGGLVLLQACQFNIKENPAWEKYYNSYGTKGAFVLHDLKSGKFQVYNQERTMTLYSPASTFKILNSLIALETGVAADTGFFLPWDSIDRGWSKWNQDQTMHSAFHNSAVWYYQELARRIGRDSMEKYVKLCRYGNQNIDRNIDDFWLRGELRITPMQQVDFLKRLYYNKLPFSQPNMDMFKALMIVEQTDDYTLRAKTGWSLMDSIGWYVGYVEKPDNVWFFANNIRMGSVDKMARQKISFSILEEMGIRQNKNPER